MTRERLATRDSAGGGTLRRLLFVSRSIPLHCRGGMEYAAWDLARALLASGVETSVLTTRVPGRGERFAEEGVAVRALAGTTPGRYGHAWWRLSRRAYGEEFSGRVDGVLSVSAGACGLRASAGAAPRPPFVFQVHGTALRDLASGWRMLRPRPMLATPLRLAALARELRAYARFDAVVAVSAGLAAELARPPAAWVLDRERLALIPNGIDAGRFRFDPEARRRAREEFALPSDAPVVLSASRLHAQKGLDAGLRGFARLADESRSARYLIAGEGPDRARLESFARSLGVAGRVVFAGPIRRERLPGVMSAADVFLFTTLHREGAPLGILEALACGLPAVVSAHLREPVSWGAPVFPVEPRDPQSIASGLELAFAAGEPALREAGGSALAGAPRGSRPSLLPGELTLERTAIRYRDLFTRLLHARSEGTA